MNAHPFDKVNLLAYVTGSCSAEKRHVIEEHLSSCDACRSYCKGLGAEKNAFLAERPFEETITVPQRRSAKATLCRFGVVRMPLPRPSCSLRLPDIFTWLPKRESITAARASGPA